ncbi:MAG TPA: hypothetical protein VK992_00430 [Candidatus Caenarcaniphilales bacterium]|nr:hypothetical protein [Candidatus Caenarcaniphilales bacterium]
MFAVAAAATYALAYSMPISAQLTPWLAAAVGLGIVAALLARRILGVLLLATGAFVGLLLHLHIRLASGEAAIHELSVNSQFYGAALAAAVLAYVATVTLLWFLTGRRRRPRRSASAAAEG